MEFRMPLKTNATHMDGHEDALANTPTAAKLKTLIPKPGRINKMQ